MPIREYKPVTPGRRGMTAVISSEISKESPYKPLTFDLRKQSGRNFSGRITMQGQGGGHKQLYRIIDFKRDKRNMPAKVVRIEYDPNRTAKIALLQYSDGERRYIIHPEGLKVNDLVMSGEEVEIKTGNALPLKSIPVGSFVHNVELSLNKGGQMGRSAGSSLQLMAKEGKYAQLRLNSGEIRLVLLECYSTIGQVSNIEHENVIIGKAGRNRWRGIRPQVRGMTKNPCDHPHGGGEGKSKGGNLSQSPTGVCAKGFKTRKSKPNDWMIVKRRK